MVSKIKEKSIANNAITSAKLSAEVASVTGIKVSSIAYLNDDTAANTIGGDVITVTGAGFTPNTTVYIDRTQAGVVTYVSNTQLTFSSPAKTAGSYILYLYNADGGSAAYIPGINYSGIPAWSTASGSIGTTYEFTSFSGNVSTLSATSDSTVYYLLNSGTLPTGAVLNANTGVITGNTGVISSQTTYNFVIEAKDQENQGTLRNFSITINPDTVTWASPADGATINGYVGTPVNQALSATSAAGQSIVYTANTLPSGLSISGSNVTGTPTLVQSITSLITATSNATNRTATRILNWIIAIASEIYFPYVALLLKTTATNTQNNSTFLDSSTNNFSITRAGTPTQGSFTPYRPDGYWSNYFIPTSQLLNASTSVGAFGSNNFTVECWFYPTVAPPTSSIIVLVATLNGASTNGWQLYYANGGWGVRSNIANFITGATVLPVTNAWNHVAWTRNNSTGTATYYLYLNGVRINNNDTTMGTWNDTTVTVNVASANTFAGYISNVRFVNGVAVYAAGNKGVQVFTPPSLAPLQTSGAASAASYPSTANVNTSFLSSSTTLLTCQSNRFKDNSSSPITLTLTSTPTVQAFQPFPPTASYTPAAYGGSGYFIGGSDYILTPSSAAFAFPGAFTVEGWFFWTSIPPAGLMNGGNVNNSFGMYTNGTYLGFNIYNVGNIVTVGSFPLLNSWHHIAMTRDGSNNCTIWVDGVNSASAVSAHNFAQSAWVIYNSSGTGGACYISNYRVVKGTAVYTGNFTPPTLAPLTTAGSTSAASYPSTTNINTSFASSATSLLINSTNAGIYDAAGQNYVITQSGAQVNTTTSKWNTTSMKFNGSTDYLTMPVINLGSGATASSFTVEGWFYTTSAASDQTIISQYVSSSSGWCVRVVSSRLQAQLAGDPASIVSTTTILSNTWYYFALSGSVGSWKLFMGTSGTTIQEGSTQTGAVNLGDNASLGLQIGRLTNLSYFNGYIQDIRLTRGIARYTTPPSVPTAEFPVR